jgi:hypothetical protein
MQWRGIFGRTRWERDLDDEFSDHLQRRADDLMRGGLARAEAQRRARLEFGAREAFKEQCREAHGFGCLDGLWQDLRYGWRTLRRSPVFCGVAIASLALAIGANTVVFSAVNALLLRPLPVADPGRVYSMNFNRYLAHSFPNYRDIRDRNSVFASLFATRMVAASLDHGGSAQRVWGYLVTGNYWDALGISPTIGRFFSPAEDRQPGGAPYAVLSYACWRHRFGGDPQIAGTTVRINGLAYTVLGVAPRGFQGTELLYWPEIWIPMSMQAAVEGRSWLEERNCTPEADRAQQQSGDGEPPGAAQR